MLRERNPLVGRCKAAVLFGLVLLAPMIAEAGELSVNLRETSDGVVVELRGLPANAASQEVITSKTGALLFLPDQTSPVRRIDSPPKHRLDFVQVGQAGKKVAVRIVQRKRANGSLGKFMRSTPVAGGIDVLIQDGTPKPAATEAAPDPNAANKAAALARLAGPAEESEAAVPVPVPVPEARPEVELEAEPEAAAEPPARRIEHDTKAAPVDDAPRRAAAFEDDATASSPNVPNGRALGWVALASLCFLGALATWKIRKRKNVAQTEALRVVSRVALGPKQQIVWLVAGDRALLVGATEHNISLISELGRLRNEVPVEFPEVAPTATATDPNAGGKIAAFKQKLRLALGDELAGKSDMPPHLELLTADPKWTRKDTA